MAICFHGKPKEVYVYLTSSVIYDLLLEATSVGQFVNQVVKKQCALLRKEDIEDFGGQGSAARPVFDSMPEIVLVLPASDSVFEF